MKKTNSSFPGMKVLKPDFLRYILYESSDEQLTDEHQIFETSSVNETMFEVLDVVAGIERYYRVLVERTQFFKLQQY